MLKNYVISLTTAHQRREHIQQEFGKQKIAFEFFDALVPSETLQTIIQQELPALSDEPNMSDGEKACLMSHLSLWQKCIDDNLDYIGIFEDDIFLGKNTDVFLNQTDWLKQRFNDSAFFLRLETSLKPVHIQLNHSIPAYHHRQFFSLKSSTTACGGYIISQAAAKLLLKEIKHLEAYYLNPIDVLAYDQLNALPNYQLVQLNPALCVQEIILNPQRDQFSSQLETDRLKRFRERPKKKKKRSFVEKIKHILTKPARIIAKSKREIVHFE